MGFVQKEQSKKYVNAWLRRWLKFGKKELITVEVKAKPITFLHILQAKLYQDIFRSTFGLLISPEGIIGEKVQFLLETEMGRSIRGKVIIAKLKELSYGAQYGQRTLWTLQINPKFKDTVPEPFKKFCKL